jgi:transposase
MTMAKAAKKPNKSDTIRAALTANPDKPVPDIAKDLGVTAGLVYNVKANMKKKAGQPAAKRGRKPGSKVAPKTATAPASAHHALDAAFEFIHKVGGVLHAEELIAKLKSLKEKL